MHPIPQEQLEQLAKRTVPPYLWLGWLTLLMLIAALAAWAVWGSLSIRIEGKGVLLKQKGLFQVQASWNGILKKILVKPGDRVQEGTLVAEIYDEQKDRQLAGLQIQIKALTEEVKRLTQQVETETEASKKALSVELVSKESTIDLLQQQLDFITQEYKKKEGLYKEKLIVIGDVQDAKRQIHDTQIAIAEKKKEISEIKAKLMQSYRTEELKNKQMELLKAEQEALVLEIELQQNQIYSPYAGEVLEILVNEGELITQEQALINAEYGASDQQLVIYAYFPSEWGKFIHVGSSMTLLPATINRKEFGGVLSQVERVGAYPVSDQAIVGLVHNADLARLLAGKGPATEVLAIPLQDPNDPSRYAWTSHKGPPETLHTGTFGEVEIVVESIPPIYYLFPNRALKESAIKEPLTSD